MNPEKVYQNLNQLHIPYQVYNHPPTPSVEDALPYWEKIDATHCKNLFFRNHKGNKHYLVIFHHLKQLNIRQLEKLLKQGKLSFASEKRMIKYLGLTPGSVSPFGIINDSEKHVQLFIDEDLMQASHLSFHPNINTSTVVISKDDFLKFLNYHGNPFIVLTFNPTS
ncbi:MAG: prolyl-tRNA synthetase associated domain-containing protein [Bacteroidetes bacterium]|nr:prolyl-tRNA synthetase associated domain-containing protein [Bacteroidota bacterium]MBU1578805.1 prolyl-tRNA synthetase associated domain-containing protein [Bacteroidota bacterium]MBU2466771.1 prolyl-tRNA synthetase associated domain-containing protein [Bacteroidota bacterium]MBU2556851.1 prolyl-tRNA synthetase associated domain-containing protein [Bacteroidota bacterium]